MAEMKRLLENMREKCREELFRKIERWGSDALVLDVIRAEQKIKEKEVK